MENQETNIENKPPVPQESQPKEGSVGPIIGSIIVIILVIIGGLYFWGMIINEKQKPQTQPSEINEDESLNNLTVQDDSDEINSIEADLNSTELENLDKEMAEVETEFNSN